MIYYGFRQTASTLSSYLVLNVRLLVLVQVDLEQPGTVQTNSGPLSHDLGGVDEVVKDSVVDRNQCPGDGPLLLQLVGLAGRLLKDATLGNEYHVATGKLLLQLADQPNRRE